MQRLDFSDPLVERQAAPGRADELCTLLEHRLNELPRRREMEDSALVTPGQERDTLRHVIDGRWRYRVMEILDADVRQQAALQDAVAEDVLIVTAFERIGP